MNDGDLSGRVFFFYAVPSFWLLSKYADEPRIFSRCPDHLVRQAYLVGVVCYCLLHLRPPTIEQDKFRAFV